MVVSLHKWCCHSSHLWSWTITAVEKLTIETPWQWISPFFQYCSFQSSLNLIAGTQETHKWYLGINTGLDYTRRHRIILHAENTFRGSHPSYRNFCQKRFCALQNLGGLEPASYNCNTNCSYSAFSTVTMQNQSQWRYSMFSCISRNLYQRPPSLKYHCDMNFISVWQIKRLWIVTYFKTVQLLISLTPLKRNGSVGTKESGILKEFADHIIEDTN